MNRLADNEKRFGPLVFAKAGWKRFSFVWSTHDDDDDGRGNAITVYAFGYISRKGETAK